jgi:hypothetical protein
LKKRQQTATLLISLWCDFVKLNKWQLYVIIFVWFCKHKKMTMYIYVTYHRCGVVL